MQVIYKEYRTFPLFALVALSKDIDIKSKACRVNNVIAPSEVQNFSKNRVQ